jgi:hypothetical protein
MFLEFIGVVVLKEMDPFLLFGLWFLFSLFQTFISYLIILFVHVHTLSEAKHLLEVL